jgi:O-succinylbenzoic acid--CoA ligase
VAAYAAPKTIRFANDLPRTASGTVDRDAVRARLLERRGE